MTVDHAPQSRSALSSPTHPFSLERQPVKRQSTFRACPPLPPHPQVTRPQEDKADALELKTKLTQLTTKRKVPPPAPPPPASKAKRRKPNVEVPASSLPGARDHGPEKLYQLALTVWVKIYRAVGSAKEWPPLSASQQREMDGAIVMLQQAMDQVSVAGEVRRPCGKVRRTLSLKSQFSS